MTVEISNLEIFNLNPIPVVTFNLNEVLVNFEDIQILKNIPMLNHVTTSNLKLSDSTHILNDYNLHRIKEKFDDVVEIYTNQLLCIKNKFKMTHSWLTKNDKNCYHPKHYHENNIVSAVAYFNEDGTNTPVSSIKFSMQGLDTIFSNFKFAYDVSDWNLYNSKTWTIQPMPNQIIVFPGVLEHESLPNVNDISRYCIGVNYFINDIIGPNRQYSELTVSV